MEWEKSYLSLNLRVRYNMMSWNRGKRDSMWRENKSWKWEEDKTSTYKIEDLQIHTISLWKANWPQWGRTWVSGDYRHVNDINYVIYIDLINRNKNKILQQKFELHFLDLISKCMSVGVEWGEEVICSCKFRKCEAMLNSSTGWLAVRFLRSLQFVDIKKGPP